MDIITMLNAMEFAKWRAQFERSSSRRGRQYHAFRDGIHRRFVRLQMRCAEAESMRDFWREEYMKTGDEDA